MLTGELDRGATTVVTGGRAAGGSEGVDDETMSKDEELSSEGRGVVGHDLLASSFWELGTRSNRILRSLGQVLTWYCSVGFSLLSPSSEEPSRIPPGLFVV